MCAQITGGDRGAGNCVPPALLCYDRAESSAVSSAGACIPAK